MQVTGTGFGSTSRPITISSVSMVDVVNAGNIVAVDSAMTGSGDLIKLGDGALALRGNNAAGYTGDITVSGGTLAIGISDSLGNANRVTVESGARLIIEADEEWGSLTGGGDVDLGSYYIRVGFDDSDAGLSGTITGAGVFRKAGAGTMTLSGASDYSGGTYVDDGTLIADHDNALGTGNVTVGAATLVVADGAGRLRLAATIHRDRLAHWRSRSAA